MNRFRCKQVESVAVLGFKKLAKTFFTDVVENSSHMFEPLFTRKSEVKAATVPARAAASRQDFRAVAYPRFLLCSSAACSVVLRFPRSGTFARCAIGLRLEDSTPVASLKEFLGGKAHGGRSLNDYPGLEHGGPVQVLDGWRNPLEIPSTPPRVR
jgi:hypothetical protein